MSPITSISNVQFDKIEVVIQKREVIKKVFGVTVSRFRNFSCQDLDVVQISYDVGREDGSISHILRSKDIQDKTGRKPYRGKKFPIQVPGSPWHQCILEWEGVSSPSPNLISPYPIIQNTLIKSANPIPETIEPQSTKIEENLFVQTEEQSFSETIEEPSFTEIEGQSFVETEEQPVIEIEPSFTENEEEPFVQTENNSISETEEEPFTEIEAEEHSFSETREQSFIEGEEQSVVETEEYSFMESEESSFTEIEEQSSIETAEPSFIQTGADAYAHNMNANLWEYQGTILYRRQSSLIFITLMKQALD